MEPLFIPDREESTIIMNTTPLAPRRAVAGKKNTCTSPETRAVTAMQNSSFFEPYLSSSVVPMTSMSMMLLM